MSQQYNKGTLEDKLHQHSDAIAQLMCLPASLQNPDTQDITSPIKALLDIHDGLDYDSKKDLLSSAISANNMQPQCSLLDLRGAKGKTGTTQAKLTKELNNLVETYKAPELHFKEQATK